MDVFNNSKEKSKISFIEVRNKIYASINGTKGNLIKLKKSTALNDDEVKQLNIVISELEKLRQIYVNNYKKKKLAKMTK